jgi:hypothetical protein
VRTVPSVQEVRRAARAIVEAVNAGEPFSAREVATRAGWPGLDYAPPYDPELDGPATTADEHETAQRLYAFALRDD